MRETACGARVARRRKAVAGGLALTGLRLPSLPLMVRAASQDRIGEGLWLFESGRPGPAVAISFGVHGDERAPIDAGLVLAAELEKDARALRRGRVLLVFGNPRAAAEKTRWSKDGVDLNRCFHVDVLAREPALHEEHRSREIVAALARSEAEVLVDFHCTVEPGRRFLMHHPPVDEPGHRRIRELLYEEGFTISGARNRLDNALTGDEKAEPAPRPSRGSAPIPGGADLAAIKRELREVLDSLRA